MIGQIGLISLIKGNQRHHPITTIFDVPAARLLGLGQVHADARWHMGCIACY